MVWIEKTYQAPPNLGNVFLGRTLPSLLDEVCDRAPNSQAFNQWTEAGWKPLSNMAFQASVEAAAIGLLDLGLERGDRVALLMHSDVNFCITDMACLLAGLVNVPIDLTQTLEQIIFVLQHSEARAIVISNPDLLKQIAPYLQDISSLQCVMIAEVPEGWRQTSIDLDAGTRRQGDAGRLGNDSEHICLDIPMLLHPAHAEHFHVLLPQCIRVYSLDEIYSRVQVSEARSQQLRKALTPDQLATIIYIPDEVGQLQGVMLTHENLSANALASFSCIGDLQRGEREVVLSFLPLNHVLARCMIYGHISYGHSIYFSSPNRVMKHLKEVQPTILTTVPLMLEKAFSKILEKGNKLNLFGRIVFNWVLNLAKRYELGSSPKGLYALQLKLADWLVLSKWRAAFGGRLKYLICGGAALKAELANAFAAAGIVAMHGYGLTQASAVVCFNRDAFNRAGTVGVPIAGVELEIAPDHEILLRSPYNTPGFYKNPVATQAMIDDQGWLHTGDLGTITSDGFLKITGLKKALFKLSTGKYIAPQPIERRLNQSALIAEAIAVGAEQKFCAALIFPNPLALHSYALENGIDPSPDVLLKHPCITALYQSLVNAANCHLPYWAIVKRFCLVNVIPTLENGLLKASGELDRANAIALFNQEINELFGDTEVGRRGDAETRRRGDAESDAVVESICPPLPEADCPLYARSLNPRLTMLGILIATQISLSVVSC